MSRITSRLVAHPSIFKMFMKGKFDDLWPKFPKLIKHDLRPILTCRTRNYATKKPSASATTLTCIFDGHDSQLHPQLFFIHIVKFIYSTKATKFCEISSNYLTGSTQDKYLVKILQIFLAFSEYMNFTSVFLWLLEVFEVSFNFFDAFFDEFFWGIFWRSFWRIFWRIYWQFFWSPDAYLVLSYLIGTVVL